jgi:hypothetical protein
MNFIVYLLFGAAITLIVLNTLGDDASTRMTVVLWMFAATMVFMHRTNDEKDK